MIESDFDFALHALSGATESLDAAGVEVCVPSQDGLAESGSAPMSGNDVHARGRPAAGELRMNNKLPLVRAGSDRPGAPRMANPLAIGLDRDGAAQISCIAGVCGGVTE
ncbi:MAG: hypothetical protein M3Q96_05115 [Pseudomonadota bacterium]|nr:hypothetical protein [Pseudomonadota bacterium]MDQ3229828.1 hypothetical protein [Pseudomonadota bacterium]